MKQKELITILNAYKDQFNPVVPFEPSRDRLIHIDFTENNTELTDELLNDTQKFTAYINEKLHNANARYAVGGYAEHRTVYVWSKLFNAHNPPSVLGETPEPRRLHLGTDIWGRPNVPVICPIDGIIHSFAFNNGYGDYGATIILSHQLEGKSFFTLYGHLSLNSLKNIQEGDTIRKGDIFAEFGISFENGQWPPHLHFQIINDIEGWKGDYPGVCKFSEKEAYMANSPDPDLILQMNQYVK